LVAERAVATGNWNAFDAAVTELSRSGTHDSLVAFYRAVASLERRKDAAAATRHLEQALSTDPTFARARSVLVLLQPSQSLALAELNELVKVHPNHRWSAIAVASN
jgi:hypothetical protein